MSLTVEKLNDDTTFLFSFAPSFAPKSTTRKLPGAFTILIDPWLGGETFILHPVFQLASHTSECAIKSLAELKDHPDVIIISQEKPDHCHRETLCSLPKTTRTRILATPAAAKTIRSWKHFHPETLHVMAPYYPDKPSVVTRIRLEPYTSSSSAGEITIANIVTKYDMTRLHNAIGITYRPPGSLLSAVGGETVNLLELSRPATSPSALHKARSAAKLSTNTPTSPNRQRAFSAPRPNFLDPLGRSPTPASEPSTPSPHHHHRIPCNPSLPARRHKEQPLSVLYTPHGLSLPALQPYLTHHLHRIGALPLTALFHCLNSEENPLFLGGLVARGAPGGVEVAAGVGARYWVGAHDEAKTLSGVATRWIRSRRYSAEEVRGMLWERESVGGVKRREGTEVRLLGVGERMRIDG
ncbi:hypothetical protein LTR91_020329 [Friedmanniomyces endolithicus]|uniref:Uncharacterized protein n=1 Tax=Friedmanniomyces endolithicus TaxID=329885 RepID=A0AAN6H827_9PEZI|nr:hypothetical protein LTR94_013264 [Friedmanniomyces endolithicus]KAK0771065.1 hypothetical protein LTR59_016252 [Friedmanniomyces endolithicus]KAK0773827.1 hypothetical protein LTR38_016440 [Friedmanniomyces endolithicus]KAK0776788.1 hypothetical protein LTR75_016154 [Friedmanniomyces endolithicus]KAK0863343.1 hypothetical protein LTR87_016229 [Friedmanniomyces endolithicus]